MIDYEQPGLRQLMVEARLDELRMLLEFHDTRILPDLIKGRINQLTNSGIIDSIQQKFPPKKKRKPLK